MSDASHQPVAEDGKPDAGPPQAAPPPADLSRAVPFVLPFVAFLGLTVVEGLESLREHYHRLYILKALVVAGVLWGCRSAWTAEPFRPHWIALAVGAVGCAAWVGLESLPYPRLEILGTRTAFDPNTGIASPAERAAFLAVRMVGLAVLVPLLEEVFWRGFLIRFVVDERFEDVPPGTATATGFAVVCGAFTLSHPEWLPAVLYAAATNVVWMRTRSLWACIQMHAATNLLLGVWVLVSGDWRLW